MANFFEGKKPEVIISGQSISGDYTSSAIEILPWDRVGVEVEWSASTLSATIYPQVSIIGNQYSNLVDSGANPIAIAITGSSGAAHFDLDVKAFAKLKVFIDHSSGSGTISIAVVAKGKYNG